MTHSKNRGLKSNITNENKRNKKEYRERIIKKEKEKEIEEKKKKKENGIESAHAEVKRMAFSRPTSTLGFGSTGLPGLGFSSALSRSTPSLNTEALSQATPTFGPRTSSIQPTALSRR